MWNHGLVWQIHSVQIGSNDQLAATLESCRAFRGPWVTRLPYLAGTESLSRTLTAADTGSSPVSLVPDSEDGVGKVAIVLSVVAKAVPTKSMVFGIRALTM